MSIVDRIKHYFGIQDKAPETQSHESWSFPQGPNCLKTIKDGEEKEPGCLKQLKYTGEEEDKKPDCLKSLKFVGEEEEEPKYTGLCRLSNGLEAEAPKATNPLEQPYTLSDGSSEPTFNPLNPFDSTPLYTLSSKPFTQGDDE